MSGEAPRLLCSRDLRPLPRHTLSRKSTELCEANFHLSSSLQVPETYGSTHD